MKKTSRIFAFLSALAALAATPALAQAPQAVKLSGDVRVVKSIVDEAGVSKVQLIEPKVVVPGDRLIFRTDYKNVSDEVVENFVVTNPLPTAVAFSPDTETPGTETPGTEIGAAFVVSVDGGSTFGDLADLEVTLDDSAARAAQPNDVTHIRWTLARLAPGESGQITFYAIVR